NLSEDIVESFRIFQGRINEEYHKLVEEYNMLVIDASQPVEKQQEQVRRIIAEKIDLSRYKWRPFK
ncbi:MAG TPA: thymidylate kinase, partial [Candidatus Sumerlaeia bacterium]|nr:thymidylate kinase [Candidatus Sumerlaeia bacterium]